MKSIIDTAEEIGSFGTLIESLKKADLAGKLRGRGPFTVFAPTDDAFSNIPKDTLEEILGDRKRLLIIMSYHVVPKRMMSKDMKKSSSVRTLQGSSLLIDVSEGVMVNKARVLKTDIECSNGVMHIIDSVLLP